MTGGADPDATIGVAVPLPDDLAAYLDGIRVQIGDPLARAMPAHITLVPPLSADAAAIDAIVDHLAVTAATFPPFEIGLSGTATFRPVSPVVFVALREGYDECSALQKLVCTGPLAVELRFPFHPHVTVGFELPDDVLDSVQARLADYRAEFDAREFCLYECQPDGRWIQRRRFALG